MKEHNPSRRDFVKKAAYVAPAVLSLQAFSAVAKAGSNKDREAQEAAQALEADTLSSRFGLLS